MPVTSMQRSLEQYSPLSFTHTLDTAPSEIAFRNFLTGLNDGIIEAILQAYDTDFATTENVALVRTEIVSIRNFMASQPLPTVE